MALFFVGELLVVGALLYQLLLDLARMVIGAQ
jgi:hypothetical protein